MTFHCQRHVLPYQILKSTWPSVDHTPEYPGWSFWPSQINQSRKSGWYFRSLAEAVSTVGNTGALCFSADSPAFRLSGDPPWNTVSISCPTSCWPESWAVIPFPRSHCFMVVVPCSKTGYSCLVKHNTVAQKGQNEEFVCVCPIRTHIHAPFDSQTHSKNQF